MGPVQAKAEGLLGPELGVFGLLRGLEDSREVGLTIQMCQWHL